MYISHGTKDKYLYMKYLKTLKVQHFILYFVMTSSHHCPLLIESNRQYSYYGLSLLVSLQNNTFQFDTLFSEKSDRLLGRLKFIFNTHEKNFL
jgi:hypothetical protein